MTLRLPPLIPIDNEAIEASEQAHSSLLDAIEAVDASVSTLFHVVQRRYLLEAAATTHPIWSNRDSQEIVARRRLLSRSVAERVAGVGDALRYIDTRVTMVDMGALAHVVASETPYVVNAYAEGRRPRGSETNAGSVRTGPLGFLDEHAAYDPPPPEQCRAMLSAAIDVVRSAPAAPLTSAAWIALTMFAIHPFVDGNGRSARLLFHGTHSSSLRGGVDWGSLEMWALERDMYIDSIQRSVRVAPQGHLDVIDPWPFFDFVVKSSIAGAHRCEVRLAALGKMYVRLLDNMPADAAMVATFVWSERNVRYSELAELPMELVNARTIANELVSEGFMSRRERGGLNPRF